MPKYFLLFLVLSIVSLTYEQILKATKYCEVNSEIIQKKAASLEKSTVLDTAKNIFSFV